LLNVNVAGVVPPLNAAVLIAVELVLVTDQPFCAVPAFTAVNVTVVDALLTEALKFEVTLDAFTAEAKFTAVDVELYPCATLPPTMKFKAPGGPKIEICVPLTLLEIVTAADAKVPPNAVFDATVILVVAVAVLNPA
jgi:hypothetical protein